MRASRDTTRAERSDRPLFISAIGLSALLLFTLELVTGRAVLPVFGGAPAVWTTALCFYSGMVLIGYGYAHVVATRLSPRVGGLVHVGVAVLALLAALAAPRDLAVLRVPGLAPVLNVLLVLGAVSGMAAFLFSTTTPLLSSWYSRGGSDPWWLYAVSNAASLGGLLAYPFVIEPFVPLSLQRTLLTALLGVLALLLAAVVWRVRREAGGAGAVAEEPEPLAGPGAAPEAEPVEGAGPGESPTLERQALWVLAAFVPAGLLSAVTTHLATDHTSTPLLWIGPLAVYLASFVVAFSERGRRALPAIEWLVPAAATLTWIPFVSANWGWPVLVLVPLLLSAYAVLAVALHGRLALDRPGPEHLTRFYLLVSLGGLLATAFVALLAPLVFTNVYEYPILLVAALVVLALLPGPDAARRATTFPAALRDAFLRLVPLALTGALLIVLLSSGSPATLALVEMLLAIGALLVLLARSPALLAIGTTLALVGLGLYLAQPPLAQVRTFFGVTRVYAEGEGTALAEYSGTTLHGIQLRANPRMPTSYYAPSGPFGDIARVAYERWPQGARFGMVGLGVGTQATYMREVDRLTYLEIDEAVEDLARDERYFTYLADADTPVKVVLGDGRLSIADGPARAYDVIVLDAFSSDAVPAHLLTREAMEAYERALRPDGIIAFHVTNVSFDLAPAVAATARSAGFQALVKEYTPDEQARQQEAAAHTIWVVVGTPEALRPFEQRGWGESGGGRVFTDDFADVMWLLRR